MSLKDDIIAEIRAYGPMKLSDYMGRCNAYYYATRIPFGTAGDFITAPEISQIFGELVGLWAADIWQRAGAPVAFNLVELGPGRGTLMQDALRATAKVPGFHDAMSINFVETSILLQSEQKKRVPQAKFATDFRQVSSYVPTIVLANEFFDALPIDQKCGEQWRQIIVENDALTWSISANRKTVEYANVRYNVCRDIMQKIQAHGGAMLIIDYGGYDIIGDTLQAMRAHRFADILSEPGEVDLTSHVDFRPLTDAASNAGCTSLGPISQGSFLRALGLDLRAAQLARANPQRGDALLAAAARLADPDQMGDLFKVMAMVSAHWPKPAGFP
jgi:NADH dehydrogenase [ubiquinone] 1 alpha subcomplex assembly factor 7